VFELLKLLVRKPLVWILGVVVLLLVVQNLRNSPGPLGYVWGSGKPTPEQAGQHELLKQHVQDTREAVEELKANHETLRALKESIDRNHETQAVGLRLLCLQGAKTYDQQRACAEIR